MSSKRQRQYALARNRYGALGLVTSKTKTHITYPDGNTAHAWTGRHVGLRKLGRRWASKHPVWVTHRKT